MSGAVLKNIGKEDEHGTKPTHHCCCRYCSCRRQFAVTVTYKPGLPTLPSESGIRLDKPGAAARIASPGGQLAHIYRKLLKSHNNANRK